MSALIVFDKWQQLILSCYERQFNDGSCLKSQLHYAVAICECLNACWYSSSDDSSTVWELANLWLVTRVLAFVLAALYVQYSETSERIISFSSLLRAGSIRYVFGVPTLLITYGRLVRRSMQTQHGYWFWWRCVTHCLPGEWLCILAVISARPSQ